MLEPIKPFRRTLEVFPVSHHGAVWCLVAGGNQAFDKPASIRSGDRLDPNIVDERLNRIQELFFETAGEFDAVGYRMKRLRMVVLARSHTPQQHAAIRIGET